MSCMSPLTTTILLVLATSTWSSSTNNVTSLIQGHSPSIRQKNGYLFLLLQMLINLVLVYIVAPHGLQSIDPISSSSDQTIGVHRTRLLSEVRVLGYPRHYSLLHLACTIHGVAVTTEITGRHIIHTPVAPSIVDTIRLVPMHVTQIGTAISIADSILFLFLFLFHLVLDLQDLS